MPSLSTLCYCRHKVNHWQFCQDIKRSSPQRCSRWNVKWDHVFQRGCASSILKGFQDLPGENPWAAWSGPRATPAPRATSALGRGLEHRPPHIPSHLSSSDTLTPSPGPWVAKRAKLHIEQRWDFHQCQVQTAALPWSLLTVYGRVCSSQTISTTLTAGSYLLPHQLPNMPTSLALEPDTAHPFQSNIVEDTLKQTSLC